MSELQTAEENAPTELITPEVAPTDTGTGETGPDLATGEGENPGEQNQEAVNKAIGKQHAKYREEQRLRQTSDAALAQANQRLAEFEAAKPALSIPDLPDPYEDGFEEKMKARDTAIQAKAQQDAHQQGVVSQQQYQQQVAQQAQAETDKQTVASYRDKAKALGVNEASLTAAETAVVNYGINMDQLKFIIGKDEGALIMQHLAANPMDLDDLATMNPFQAAEFINSTVSQKAAALKPTSSNAPDPVKPLSGNGVDPDMNKHPALKGVKYS